MAALNFPNAPSVGDLYPQPAVAGVPVYRWDGNAWSTQGAPLDKTPVYTDGSTAMVAQLNLVTPPVSDSNASSKKYVDDSVIAKAVRYDIAQGLSAPSQLQARQNIGASAMTADLLLGYLNGLTMSTAGASTTMAIAAGVAVDRTGTDFMKLAAAISKTTAAWAVGTGNGGLDTGAIAASTWYHFHLIKRPDTGVVDVLFSLSPTAPTLPANYTLSRRIGSMSTSASSQWNKFYQDGDTFWWDSPFADMSNVAIADTVAHIVALSVPLGIAVTAIATCFYGNAVGVILYFSSPSTADVAASAVNFTLQGAASGVNAFTPLRILTDASRQIRYRAGGAAGNLYVNTFGWVDLRGR